MLEDNEKMKKKETIKSITEIANTILWEAYNEVISSDSQITCSYSKFIDYVINNTHLTYKYVLFTALLAKASDASINPLCLQKKSLLTGAYDARTVCHKVIVPFEMNVLEKALGGSNEPFLNKPARFPELSKENAVRKGNDQAILNALCDNLSTIVTSEQAYECLKYLLSRLVEIRENNKRLTAISIPDTANLPSKLMYFIELALENSFEGEVLTLLVAGVYHLLYNKPTARVEVHPVNQSGASGREISDLDIYVNDSLLVSNELKDKQYAKNDVKHAADKVLKAGGNRMFFIEGPRASASENFQLEIQNEYSDKNFMLRILTYQKFLAPLVGTVENIDSEEFVKFILKTARETKFKDEVIVYLDDLAQEVFGYNR